MFARAPANSDTVLRVGGKRRGAKGVFAATQMMHFYEILDSILETRGDRLSGLRHSSYIKSSGHYIKHIPFQSSSAFKNLLYVPKNLSFLHMGAQFLMFRPCQCICCHPWPELIIPGKAPLPKGMSSACSK